MRVQALGHAVVVTVGSAVLPRDVEALERRLPLLGPVQHLVLDLSGARDLDDAIVARLVEVLRCSAASVELRGLSLHQRRLLRYLGHLSPETPALRRSADDNAPQDTLHQGRLGTDRLEHHERTRLEDPVTPTTRFDVAGGHVVSVA
jgi:hypothetical protein